MEKFVDSDEIILKLKKELKNWWKNSWWLHSSKIWRTNWIEHSMLWCELISRISWRNDKIVKY